MSDYVKSTDFASKDTLPSGDSAKIVRGTEIDAEFEALEVAIASKADLASPNLTGSPTAPTPTAGDNDTSIATTAFVTTAVSNAVAAGFGFKNRIINGAMVIDQRNNGAAISSNSAATPAFPVDRLASFATTAARYSCQQNQGNVTRPAGFTSYAGFTAIASNSPGSTEANIVYQWIEGNNIADLGFGTASASSVTLSFWVRSSLTGQHSGSLINGSQNRGYPFTFTVNAANTWEQKTITAPGDTTGTWATDNGQGLGVIFNLGSGSSRLSTANSWQAGQLYGVTGSVNVLGTNGATFYITGVQLEKGSTATSFDYRPYGTELALCQRYYQKVTFASGVAVNSTTAYLTTTYGVTMRANPTVSLSGALAITDGSADFTQSSASISTYTSVPTGFYGPFVNFTGLTTYRPVMAVQAPVSILASAEL